MTDSFVKDPQAVLDYQWDWSAWLATSETISTYDVTVSSGITLNSDSASTTAVTAWIQGGTDGTKYTATCQIVTNQGRTDERTITLVAQSR